MFAIIADGGRQYKVSPGDRLSVDLMEELAPGAEVTFDNVLLANGGGASQVGKPTLDGAKVAAKVVMPLQKGPKLEVTVFRRRKNSRKHTGHRQKYTLVEITGIDVPGLEIVEKKDEQPAAAGE
jgi:large subunit ribosomal protein L21